MRVALDLGPWGSALPMALVERLASLGRQGGATLDLRVALDGTEADVLDAARTALAPAVPDAALSAYRLPRATEPEIALTLRRAHLSALLPDAVLAPEGAEEAVPEGVASVPLDSEAPDDPGALLAALREAATRPRWPDPEAAADALASVLARDSGALATDIADALIEAGRVGAEAGPPRLLVDVSCTHDLKHGKDIRHIMRRLAAALRAAGARRRHAEVALFAFPGREADGRNPRLIDAIGGADLGPLRFRTGDTLLMLDASWITYPHLHDWFAECRRAGGRVVTAIYDVIPMVHPETTAPTVLSVFEGWLRAALCWSDGVVCISRAVADDLTELVRERGLPHRDGLRVGWWHLGADIPRGADAAPDPELSAFLSDGAPVFLMVGTLEPRKRHADVLDAAERLWAEGRDARLLLLGREGWNVGDLAARLRDHPERGRRLMWRDQASDDDIANAYAGAAALLFPSLAEGYGLPVVEAAHHGLGAIVSDIPVLREVGNAGPIYVPPREPAALAHAMGRVLDGARPDPSGTRLKSWEESAAHLLEVLDADRWHVVLR